MGRKNAKKRAGRHDGHNRKQAGVKTDVIQLGAKETLESKQVLPEYPLDLCSDSASLLSHSYQWSLVNNLSSSKRSDVETEQWQEINHEPLTVRDSLEMIACPQLSGIKINDEFVPYLSEDDEKKENCDHVKQQLEKKLDRNQEKNGEKVIQTMQKNDESEIIKLNPEQQLNRLITRIGTLEVKTVQLTKLIADQLNEIRSLKEELNVL